MSAIAAGSWWLGANAPGRMERIVLSNTSARFPSPAPWDERIQIVSEKGVAPLAEPTMERWFTKGFRDTHADKVRPIREVFLKTSPDGYIGCGHAIRNMDHGDILRKITAPTLVIAGQHDMGTTVEILPPLATDGHMKMER